MTVSLKRADPAASLEKLLEPRSIAIIGASDDPATMGSRPVRYLSKGGFAGEVYKINPRKADEDGFLAGVADLPSDVVDLAIILVRAARVLDTLEACAAKGISAAIIGSAGFSEIGEEGAAVEQQIAEFAATSGMRVLGPNCLGFVNGKAAAYATFASLDEDAIETERVSRLAIVSQSGAFASFLVDVLERAGAPCRTWVSTGNEVDVDAADCVTYLANRPDISAIVLYLEGVKDGSRLRDALSAARAAGTVVAVVKAGRTAAGASAVASHTASIAGEDVLFDALFRQVGAVRLYDIGEIVTFAELLAHGLKPTGPRTGVLTVSGGMGALIVDECVEAGLELPQLPEAVRTSLMELVPFASVSNPLDPTGAVAGNPTLMRAFIEGIAKIDSLDNIVVFAGPALVEERYGMGIIEALLQADSFDGFIAVSGAPVAYARRELSTAGIPLCVDAITATRIIGRIVSARQAIAVDDVAAEQVQTDLSEIAITSTSTGAISERAAKAVIAALGLDLPDSATIASEDEARAFARRCSGQFVMKADVPGMTHKSEAGLVLLGIDGEAAAITAFQTLRDRLAAIESGDGVIFAEQQVSGTEVLVNVRRDGIFGLVLTVGSGGIYAEVDADVAVWLGMPGPVTFRRDLSRLRLWHRLVEYRGRRGTDLDALYHVCATLMGAIAPPGSPLREVELNPVAVLGQGQGAVALDAVAWPTSSEVLR